MQWKTVGTIVLSATVGGVLVGVGLRSTRSAVFMLPPGRGHVWHVAVDSLVSLTKTATYIDDPARRSLLAHFGVADQFYKKQTQVTVFEPLTTGAVQLAPVTAVQRFPEQEGVLYQLAPLPHPSDTSPKGTHHEREQLVRSLVLDLVQLGLLRNMGRFRSFPLRKDGRWLVDEVRL